MATTPNYGWVTPAPTDFVVDLPADFETFADAADATVKALNPGTTAGDIDYYTSSTAKARLGIGTAGQVLTVNSGATAPQWSSPTSGSMTLLNAGGTTLSGSSITVSSIPATYRDLRLVIRNYRPVNDNAKLYLRFNQDITAARHFSQETTPSINLVTGNGFNNIEFTISSGNDNATSNGLIIVDVYDYANTNTWKFAIADALNNNSTTATNINYTRLFGAYNQTGAINAVTLLADSNLTSGTLFVYGVL